MRADTVLWIDEGLTAAATSVMMLMSAGFHVECAESGAEGILKARTGTYDAVLLDLKLPDISGFELLDILVNHTVQVPVVVVTCCDDVESVVTAMRLGAADFRRKPLTIAQLRSVLQAVIGTARASSALSRGSPASSTIPIPGLAAKNVDSAEWVAALAKLANDIDASSHDPSTVHSAPAPFESSALQGLLLNVLLATDLPPAVFVLAAECFRRSVLLEGGGAPVAEHLRRSLEALIKPPRNAPEKISAILAQLESSVHRQLRAREDDVAMALGMNPSHLGRLLRSHTGLGFREWRRCIGVKHALRHLMDHRNHVAQVAYIVGYEHPSQFDREFRQVLGMTPTSFRRALTSSRHCALFSPPRFP